MASISAPIFPAPCNDGNCSKLHKHLEGQNLHRGQLYVQLSERQGGKIAVRSYYYFTSAQNRAFLNLQEKMWILNFFGHTSRTNSTGQLYLATSQTRIELETIGARTESHVFDDDSTLNTQISLQKIHRMLIDRLRSNPIKKPSLAKSLSCDDFTLVKK